MFISIDLLREPLLAARLLREEILATPVRPDARPALRAFVTDAAGRAWPAFERAAVLGADADSTDADSTGAELSDVGVDALRSIAEAAGGGAWRASAGAPFHGQAAPPASRVSALLDEVLETVNAPKAVESWSPTLRAFALHFLLRLVQPFEAPPGVVGRAAEALVLASDGFDARRMLMAGPDDVSGAHDGRPDPDGFALARVNSLVAALGRTRDRVRDAAGRAVLKGWAADRVSGLNARQRSLIDWLSEAERSLDFAEYAGLHGGRAGPSLRSLQRDWRGLREAGWIVPRTDGRWRLSTAPLDWGA